MMDITSIMLLALFVEAVIQVIKPLWDKTAGTISVTEIVSMALGAVFACVAKINMLDGLLVITQPWLLYVCYVLSGIALGRGPSFVHDLWAKLRAAQTK